MTIDKIIVIVVGLVAIIITYWFFLMKKIKEVVASGEINIEVNGGYSPEIISVPLGQKTKLNFTRTDSTECLSEIVLADFKIKKYLPLNEKVSIEITPDKKGEFIYACGMNMYKGKIIVR